MPRNLRTNSNIRELSDSEIFAAIRYLDPDTRGCSDFEGVLRVNWDRGPYTDDEIVREDKKVALLLFLASIIVLIGGVVFIWSHH
jgi:hypothetical protein